MALLAATGSQGVVLAGGLGLTAAGVGLLVGGRPWVEVPARPVVEAPRVAPRPPAGPRTIQDPVLGPMVELPGGEFWMGSAEGEGDADERPRHRVRVAPFTMGATPVTVGVWNGVMPGMPRKGEPDHPVTEVSWTDARAFCNAASIREGLRPAWQEDGAWDVFGTGYRLPTEAEWEYAARAGGEGRWCFGDDPDPLGEYAWYSANGDYRLHPVATRRPNGWGLHDMAGLVWEWCEDDWDATAYGKRASVIVAGPVSLASTRAQEPGRVVRGGCFSSKIRETRSAYRDGVGSRGRHTNLGFRCVRGALPEPSILQV